MTDQADPVPLENKPRRRPALSPVWLVPILALAVALFAAWRNYADRGPLVEVRFVNAAGVSAGETELRFRDIAVGTVESVGFSDDLGEVTVGIRLDPEIAPFVDAEARFWVVRPEVTAQGVSGLDTVLSGVYIQGAWDGVAGEPRAVFDGFDAAPILRAGEAGVTFTLRSPENLPARETPIIYKGVTVGRIGPARIDEGGFGVTADAVILAPHDALVSENTRFWDISGFSFSVGAQGAGIDFSSIASLISGGVTFDTFASGGDPLGADATFVLHPDEEVARQDFFLGGAGETVDMIAVFDDNIAGLGPGAPVQLGGLRIGEVTAIAGIVNAERFGDSRARLVATLRLSPSRVGLGEDAGTADMLDYLDTLIAQGLRARLANASLLTGGLKVELVELPGLPTLTVDRDADPYPAIPTVPGDVANIAATAQDLLARVDALPVEALLDEAIGFLAQASTVVGDPATQALPGQIGATAESLASLTARLDTLAADLESEGAALALTDALRAVEAAAAPVPDLSAEAQALLAEARGLVEEARTLPLDALASRAEAVMASADAILSDSETRALPGSLRAAVDDLGVVLTDLQSVTGDLAEQDTVAALTDALRAVEAAAAPVPDLSAEAQALLAEARALPLADLAARAAEVLASADGLLAQDATRALPETLIAALADLQSVLGDLQGITASPELQALPGQASALAGDLGSAGRRLDALLAEIERAGTVTRITEAAEDIAAAADTLPALSADAQTLMRSAASLPLDTLTDRATALLARGEAILSDPAAEALPGALTRALDSLSDTLTALDEGGAIDNVNAALLAARDAADALAEASRTLPDLADRLARAADQAGTTLADFDQGSAFGRELSAAIRQVDETADTIDRLARQIARNPQSFITGR